MLFNFTKEQEMFRNMAKEFTQREIAPGTKEREKIGEHPFELFKKMAAQGLTGIKIPKKYGGLELDWMTIGLVTEAISYYDPMVGMFNYVQSSLQALPILDWGTDEQKDKYLPAIVKADMIGCMAAVEPNVGSDATAVECMATLDGDFWVLNGNKSWITNANICDFCTVLCQTDKSKGVRGLATFIVDKGTPGFETAKIEGKMGQRSSDTGQIFFRDCRIPKDSILGPVGEGAKVALGGINHTRYGISIMAVAIQQAMLDEAVKYVQERKQFGKPIGSFQLVQESIAEMAVDLEASRLLSYNVGQLKSKDIPCPRETAIAKFHNTEAMVRSSRKAVELHGAYGLTDDFIVERIYRDAISSTIFGGTSNIMKLSIGRMITGINAVV